jgi:IS30 family transposase
MSYRHLTIKERIQLKVLHEMGWSARGIAKKLGRHPSTIVRELNRNREEDYDAEVAQSAYEKRRKSKSISQILTPLGKEEQTKMPMAFYVSSSPKVPI